MMIQRGSIMLIQDGIKEPVPSKLRKVVKNTHHPYIPRHHWRKKKMKLKRFIISYKENEQFPKGTVKSKLKFQFWFLLLFLATQCDKIIKEHKVFFFLLDCIEPVDQVGKTEVLTILSFPIQEQGISLHYLIILWLYLPVNYGFPHADIIRILLDLCLNISIGGLLK